MALRSPFRVDVVRDRASLARIVDDGQIENVYRLQVMNATEQPQRYRIGVTGMPGIGIDGKTDVEVGPAEAHWVTVAVRVPPEAAGKTGAQPIEFRIERVESRAGTEPAVAVEKSTFIVPR